MELLQTAAISNNFGLRLKYPWLPRNKIDTAAKVDSNTISAEELCFLKMRLGSQIDVLNAFVGRVENPYLWSRYVLRYEEMRADRLSEKVEEKIVIHATSISSAFEIADDNFNWRFVKRHRFGHGVSFANTVDYAAGQATQNSVYIVAGILVAKSQVGFHNTEIPPDTSDTTTNRAKSVSVKYYDNDFYPYYIVY